MNLQEFITLHTTGAINFAGHINVLYDGQDDGSGVITALTVTQAALSVNSNTSVGSTDITTVLQQVEQISFIFDNVNYSLIVNSVDYYNLPADQGSSFYLFQVQTDTPIPDIEDLDLQFGSNSGNNTLINFSPVLNNAIFLQSDDNVLLNNGNFIRRNSLRLEVDREIGSLQAASAIPSNFAAILSLSASKAQVQDSFYTDTGLINARYNGSKATPKTFANIKPALSANEFIGDIHPIDTNVEIVCLYSNNDRVNEPLLHTGPDRIPGYLTGSLGIEVTDPISSANTAIRYNLISGNFTENIDAGDILILDTGGQSGATGEKVRVVEHNAFTNIIEVERGFLQSTPLSTTPPDTEIFKIVRTDLYKIDDFVRNLSAVENAIVYEKESHSLLFTDPFGLIFSQSFCPEPVDTSTDNPGSDRRLKYNIKLIGKSPSNINIYSFEYKDKDEFGYGIYQGVMSDEVIKEAVSIGEDGYDRVNYSLLDVEFKKIEE